MEDKNKTYTEGYIDGAMEAWKKFLSGAGFFLLILLNLAPLEVISVYFGIGIFFGGYCFFAIYLREYHYSFKKSVGLGLHDIFLWPWALRDDFLFGPYPVGKERKKQWMLRSKGINDEKNN